jgi:hypothetical protein
MPIAKCGKFISLSKSDVIGLPKTAVKPLAYPNGAETGRGYQAREMTNAIEPYNRHSARRRVINEVS